MVGLPSLLAMAAAAATPRILIFSRTLGYRHDSIPDAITALKGHTSDLAWDATEDPTQFTSSNLANYDAVLFLMTTDSDDKPRKEILDEDQKVRSFVLALWLGRRGLLRRFRFTSLYSLFKKDGVSRIFGCRRQLYWDTFVVGLSDVDAVVWQRNRWVLHSPFVRLSFFKTYTSPSIGAYFAGHPPLTTA